MDSEAHAELSGQLEDLAHSASQAYNAVMVGQYDRAVAYLQGPLPTSELIEQIEQLQTQQEGS